MLLLRLCVHNVVGITDGADCYTGTFGIGVCAGDAFVLEELQNRYWQYLTENLISSIRNKKKLLNATRKKRSKNNKRH